MQENHGTRQPAAGVGVEGVLHENKSALIPRPAKGFWLCPLNFSPFPAFQGVVCVSSGVYMLRMGRGERGETDLIRLQERSSGDLEDGIQDKEPQRTEDRK